MAGRPGPDLDRPRIAAPTDETFAAELGSSRTYLWLTNVALLFGAELDAELDRGPRVETRNSGGSPLVVEIGNPVINPAGDGCAFAVEGFRPDTRARSTEAWAGAIAADPVTVCAGSADRLPLAHVRRNWAAADEACWRLMEAAD